MRPRRVQSKELELFNALHVTASGMFFPSLKIICTYFAEQRMHECVRESIGFYDEPIQVIKHSFICSSNNLNIISSATSRFNITLYASSIVHANAYFQLLQSGRVQLVFNENFYIMIWRRRAVEGHCSIQQQTNAVSNVGVLSISRVHRWST